MVEYNKKEEELDGVFHALADPTRRRILRHLKGGPQRVTDLAVQYDVSLNAVSKHLKVLEVASLIKREVRGRTHFCFLNAIKMKRAQNWLNDYQEFWTNRLDALEKFLEAEQKNEKGNQK